MGNLTHIPSIDQLDKSDPPPTPETYIIYLAIICLTNMAESQAAFALPILREDNDSADKSSVLLAIEMANTSWSNILAVLSFLVTASVDEDIFLSVVKAYQNFTSVLGLLGLTAPRDAFLSSLCKVCTPHLPDAPATKEVGPGGATIAIRSHAILNDRNVICLRALLQISQTLTPVLEDRAWYGVLETLQVSEGFMSSGKLGKREQSSVALLADVGTPMKDKLPVGGGSGTTVDNQFSTLLLLIKKLFEDTVKMEDRCFMEFLRALCRLARERCLGGGSAGSGGSGGSGGKETTGPKVAEEKCFAITKLHQVALSNVQRLVASEGDFTAWG
ncbi:hypothetical protein HK097_001774, partial [Rhizophlyctis rosea]